MNLSNDHFFMNLIFPFNHWSSQLRLNPFKLAGAWCVFCLGDKCSPLVSREVLGKAVWQDLRYSEQLPAIVGGDSWPPSWFVRQLIIHSLHIWSRLHHATFKKPFKLPHAFCTSPVIIIIMKDFTLSLRIEAYKYKPIPNIEHTVNVNNITNIRTVLFFLLLKAGWVMRELSIWGQIC